MNRQDPKYKKLRLAFLATRELWPPGTYHCEVCHRVTAAPEVDHTERVGMGGRASILLDVSKWSLKCHSCHEKKDSGMVVLDY